MCEEMHDSGGSFYLCSTVLGQSRMFWLCVNIHLMVEDVLLNFCSFVCRCVLRSTSAKLTMLVKFLLLPSNARPSVVV